MSLVSDALPILDEARGLLDDFGLRPFRVFAIVRTWTGTRVGQGTSSDVETELTVAGGKRPKVRQVDAEDVVASGGEITDTVYDVGPLTPEHTSGGTDPALLNPPLPAVGVAEVLFRIVGPGLPETGALCKRLSDDLSSPFRYTLRLQRIGRNG